MQGFKLENGDIVIVNGDIQMVEDAELTRQTVESVLNTNKGEWWCDIEEGIDFHNILGKNDEDTIQAEILDGLQQVDETFVLDSFTTSVDKRHLTATFTAHNADGEEVEVNNTWA